jgi:hypothetical protein
MKGLASVKRVLKKKKMMIEFGHKIRGGTKPIKPGDHKAYVVPGTVS